MKNNFKLPNPKTRTLEESMEHLDAATSNLALHPDIFSATEVSIATRRYVNNIEEYAKKTELIEDKNVKEKMERFWKDIEIVKEQFIKLKSDYNKTINDGKRKKLLVHNQIQKDYDTLTYYQTLLNDQIKRLVNLTIKKTDNY